MSEETRRGGAAAVVLAGFAAIAIGGALGAVSYQALKDVGGGAGHSAPAPTGGMTVRTEGLSPEVVTMVEEGHDIVANQGLCYTCHRIGAEGNGVLGPELTGIGERAGTRVSGLSAVQYIAQSLYEPKAYTVEGFLEGTMMPVTGPPSSLDEGQILKVIAFLEALGGDVTVAPGMDPRSLLPGGGAETAPAAAAEPAADAGAADETAADETAADEAPADEAADAAG